MSEKGITFNSEHSFDDYGWKLLSKTAQPAEKRITIEDVPFGNGYYDFSAASGSIHYQAREVEYELTRVASDIADKTSAETELAEWLYGCNGASWTDDLITGWHYVGTCIGIEFDSDAGLMSHADISFMAQPMRVSDSDSSVVTPC